MGLFNKKLEKRVTALEEIINNYENVDNNANKTDILDEKKKIQAAYALNLCTVSVSQIVDYDDMYIMDQEYEMILNNLNLENMPKDEALLHIFKQIMDTITFFRIQDGDKKRLEEKYKQEVKNAIWSAVPNFSVVLTGSGGNPYAAAALAAVQVGFAYMNYRKARAEIEVKHKDEEWKLQRSAIEQLNGLRRELFDTAWRISSNYNFPDEYRLTERQISQYNEILMDTNSARRFDRLEYIKDNFQAYPPFWYYLARSAFEEAINMSDNQEVFQEYMKAAEEYYKKYLSISEYALLREDNIASACCLEYAQLLIKKGDYNKDDIIAILNRAEKNAGKSNDVIQNCAISYSGIEAYDNAERLYLYLFNEGYNRVANAQFLSNLYVSSYISYFNQQKSKDAYRKYSVLGKRINENYLFPLPTEEIISQLEIADEDEKERIKEDILKDFVNIQKGVLIEKHKNALQSLFELYSEKYNSCIPLPERRKLKYPEGIYSYTKKSNDDRLEIVKNESQIKGNWDKYVTLLQQSDIYLCWIDVLNDMQSKVYNLGMNDAEKKALYNGLLNSINSYNSKIQENAKKLVTTGYSFDDFNTLFSIDFIDVSKGFWDELVWIINNRIKRADSFAEITKLEADLSNLCLNVGLPLPEYVYGIKSDRKDSSSYRLDPAFFGKDIEKMKFDKEVNEKCLEITEKYRDIIVTKRDEKGKDTKIGYRCTRDEIAHYFDNKNKQLTENSIIHVSDVLAIIDDNSGKDIDLILAKDYIAIIEGRFKNRTAYKGDYYAKRSVGKCDFLDDSIKITYDSKWIFGKLKYYSSEFKSKYVNMTEFRKMFDELMAEISAGKEAGKEEVLEKEYCEYGFKVNEDNNLLYFDAIKNNLQSDTNTSYIIGSASYEIEEDPYYMDY